MKKKIIILVTLIIVAVLLIVSFISYSSHKANEYTKNLTDVILTASGKPDIKENVQLEKIIKRTPTNLVILVKWGNNERAYISIENWMTKRHDYIEVDIVGKIARVHE